MFLYRIFFKITGKDISVLLIFILELDSIFRFIFWYLAYIYVNRRVFSEFSVISPVVAGVKYFFFKFLIEIRLVLSVLKLVFLYLVGIFDIRRLLLEFNLLTIYIKYYFIKKIVFTVFRISIDFFKIF